MTSFLLGLVIGLIIGGCSGVFFICLFISAASNQVDGGLDEKETPKFI